MQYEIKSMSPSLVYYNWLILRTLRRNVTHSQFKIHQSVKRFINNVTLVDQEWLKPRVALFCRRKNTLLKYLKTPATTSDNHFNFSRSDDDFEKLAKEFQPKNTKEFPET